MSSISTLQPGKQTNINAMIYLVSLCSLFGYTTAQLTSFYTVTHTRQKAEASVFASSDVTTIEMSAQSDSISQSSSYTRTMDETSLITTTGLSSHTMGIMIGNPPVPVSTNTSLQNNSRKELQQPGTIAAFVMGTVLLLILGSTLSWCLWQKRKTKQDRHSEHYNLEKGEGGEWVAKQTRRRFRPQFRRKTHHQPRLTVTRIGPPRPIDPPKNMSVTNINAHMGRMVQMPMTLKSVTKPSTFTKSWPAIPTTTTNDDEAPFLHSRSGSNSDSPVIGDKLFEGAEAEALDAVVHQVEITNSKDNKILKTYSILQPAIQNVMKEGNVVSKDRVSTPYTICDFFSPDEVRPCPSPPRKNSLLVKVAYSPDFPNHSSQPGSPPRIVDNLDAIDKDIHLDGYRRSILVITSPNGTHTVHKPFEIQIPPSVSPPQKYSPLMPHTSPTMNQEVPRAPKPVELVDPQKSIKRKSPPKPLLNLTKEIVIPPGESPPLSPLIFTFDDTPQIPPQDSTAWHKRSDSEHNEQVKKTIICAEVKMGPCTPDSVQTSRHHRFSYDSVSTAKQIYTSAYAQTQTRDNNDKDEQYGTSKRVSEPVTFSANVTSFSSSVLFSDSSLYSPTFGAGKMELSIEEVRQQASEMVTRPQTVMPYF